MCVITSITGVESIIRQTRVEYGWLVVGQSVAAGLRPIGCTHTQYVACGAI